MDCFCRSTTPLSDQPNSPQDHSIKQEDQSEYESSSTTSDNPENISTSTNPDLSSSKLMDDSPNNNMRSKRSPRSPSSPNPTETPFKCHLCDSGFAVRDDCLNHLSVNHTAQFEELIRKTSFDEETRQRSASDNEERRSKPDYSHRKVNFFS